MLTAAKATLAELVAAAGDTVAALATVDEALEIVQRTEERYYEPELHRLKATTRRTRPDRPGCPRCRGRALSRRVARVGAVRREGVPTACHADQRLP